MKLVKYGFCSIVLFVGSALVAGGAWFILAKESCVSSPFCFRPLIETVPYALWQLCLGMVNVVVTCAFLKGTKSTTWVIMGSALLVLGALLLMVNATDGFGAGLVRGDAVLFVTSGIGLLGCGAVLIGQHFARER